MSDILKEQATWALVTGLFPVLPVDDHEARHRAYGPAFGPSLDVTVLDDHDQPHLVLAVSSAFAEPGREAADALRAAGRDWLRLARSHKDHPLLPDCTSAENLTLLEVALRAPHGLLVARGLIRTFGHRPLGPHAITLNASQRV